MLKTANKHFLDYLLWPILFLVWEPFFSKRSHFWHWKDFNKVPQLTERVQSDNAAKPRVNLWNQLIETNFGWNKVAIFEPAEYNRTYQVGFSAMEEDGKKTQLCEVLLKGPFGVLVGPYPLEIFAVSFPEAQPLKLTKIEETTKDRLDQDVILV